MDSREEEQEDDTPRSFLSAEDTENVNTINSMTTNTAEPTNTTTAPKTTVPAHSSSGVTVTPGAPSHDQTEAEEAGELAIGNSVAMAVKGAESAGAADVQSQQKSLTPAKDRPDPPSSLALSGSQPAKKKVLAAPALSLSLDRSESTISDDFPSAFLSLSPEDDDDTGLDFDLDAMETPSDSESLPFPIYDLEDDLQRLGMASHRRRPFGSGLKSNSDSQTCSVPGPDQSGLGALEREDMVDSQGTRWRIFSTGDLPQESRVNMSVLEPFLRVLSHGGYYGDGMNDIIVFSSCYLPENSLENYQYVMDNLFRYVVGTLDLMVTENYVIVYLCAGGQKDKLPGISWLKECYTTIHRRLRKNLKGFYVVHPTWYIKALITIIKPFISSKFSRKLQFVDSLQDLSRFIPTEHVQIPDYVRQYDQSLSR
ncbi:bcl-2/adenovirus E1B 19 kDa-interacting protein 2-like protein isoform X1 [Toxotes jaculatrix]|uniref:bcl-2/adenovirus E1B 19 kDa-interacting protein 2-like protein isoform X1 n=1 Tax=Toxotes jaculatrix TaxID=941984 RepID=UPI001B3A85CB|nr:bcl-2/adenovirus E1B 19 kDa-interacting protein 2-like protein isoform X1 [Toxotes jaculatrix]XP_040910132.1 bcl-2/adenovirus E1B 19 kDa-interacting protein 2-like protein isoform X1 [Toxotes jaculatrix]XP_040910133.1 bcl-2/adenovirus E1B 19 kDa-interacting protein 2-like protein isoform X1 [Toxotes jaculatrix]